MALLLPVLGVAACGAAAPGPAGAGAPDAAVVGQARAFAAVASAGGPGPTVSVAATRRWVRARARRIPLPRGGTFDGIAWDAGPPPSLPDADTILQHNARCQWLRAVRDGRERATGRAVLRVVAGWPAIRREAATSWLPVGDADRLRACDASHDREVAYAAAHGGRPST